MRVVFGIVLAAILLAGCRENSSSLPTQGAIASGATADSASLAGVDVEPMFPIIVPATKETLSFQKQAELDTKYADEQICAFMDDMAPGLAAARPEGLGCPRDKNPGAK